MEKGLLIIVLALITGLVFVGGVWGQTNSPSGAAFSGTVTKVDLTNKEIVVQNDDREMTFQWNNETQFNGLPVEKAELDSGNLMEGKNVTVLYEERDQKKVANRIDVKTVNIKTLKGIEYPFECGVKVC